MDLDKFNSFIKRYRIFQQFPSVYETIGGFNEFGPYGATIKANIVNIMRDVFRQEAFWEVDCPLISPYIVWKASGHADRFVDIVAESDGKMYRVDKVFEELYPDENIKEKSLEGLTKLVKERKMIPEKNKEPLTNVHEYNLMMKTSVAGIDAFLRPETATTTYLSFSDYYNLFRERMPIMVFQYGRAFRNEIATKHGLMRGREFEQLEGQIFIFKDEKKSFEKFKFAKKTKHAFFSEKDQVANAKPKTMTLEKAVADGVLGNEAYAYCFFVVLTILERLGIDTKRVRYRQHLKDEKAHYALDAWDIEVQTEAFGWVEICGVHDRGDYDLTRHQEFSKTNYAIKNKDGQPEIPHILEIAFGVGRSLYCSLEHSFSIRNDKNVLKLPLNIAPIQVAVFPLVKRENLPEKAEEIYNNLRMNHIIAFYDQAGSIGKRYARMDEIGTPFCITVDSQINEDNKVTIRDRDTGEQIKLPPDELASYIKSKL